MNGVGTVEQVQITDMLSGLETTESSTAHQQVTETRHHQFVRFSRKGIV